MRYTLRLLSIFILVFFGTLSAVSKTPEKTNLKKEMAALIKRIEILEAQQKTQKNDLINLNAALETAKNDRCMISENICTKLRDHEQSHTNSQELERILIKYGNNPDGMTAMHYAIKMGDLNALQLLIVNGADVNAKDGDFTALTRAATYNQYEISKFLLGLGADVNLVADKQSTPYALDYAAKSGSGELVNLLIECGAILDRSRPSDDSGYPKGPLHTAAKAGNYDAVVALVKAGAKIDGICPQKTHHTGDNNNMTPLSVASIELKYLDNPQHLELVKFLVESGATRRLVKYYKGHTCNGCVNCPIISGYLQSVER